MNPVLPLGLRLLCLNDWPARRLLLVVASLQVAVLAFLANPPLALTLSPVRNALGTLYLTALPGAVLLRALGFRGLTLSRTLVYTVSLSLVFAFVVGFLANSILPALGIRPLSEWPVALTFTLALNLVTAIAVRDGRDYHCQTTGGVSGAWLLAFLALPVVAAWGAALVTSAQVNTVLLVLLPILAITPVLIVGLNVVPPRIYPWAVLMVALAVILHVSLISPFLVGRDIQLEYRLFEVAAERGQWQATRPDHSYNTSLAITILPVLLLRLSGLDGMSIFKVIIPGLLSLVPLALYEVLRPSLHGKAAALAAFFLIFQYSFFFTAPQAARQAVGWVLLAAMTMTFVNETAPRTPILQVAFLLGIVVSHYGTAYLAVVLLTLGVAILTVLRRRSGRLGVYLPVLAVVASGGWYLYIAGSGTFDTHVGLGRTFIDALRSGFSEPGGQYAIDLLSRAELSAARLVVKYQYLGLQVLVAVGMIGCALHWVRRRAVRFPDEFMALATASFAIFGLTVLVPYLATFADINRVFSLPLFFTAPFAVVGAAMIAEPRRKVRRAGREDERPAVSPGPGMVAMALFAASFLLFGGGFVSEVQRDAYPISFALSGTRIHAPIITPVDYAGAQWLVARTAPGARIFYDFMAETVFLLTTPPDAPLRGALAVTADEPPRALTTIPGGAYVYLRRGNVRTQQFALAQVVSAVQLTPRLTSVENLPPEYLLALQGGQPVYDNGGSRVLLRDLTH